MPRLERGVRLFDTLTSFENLYRAACDARRGKRFKPDVARFHYDVARSLVDLRDELVEGRYRPGPYRTFTIYEPARRFISAAPYRDRVVHHALCNVMEPLFEKSFIFDSYANRVGKGTHRALDRCTEYARRFRYVLQAGHPFVLPKHRPRNPAGAAGAAHPRPTRDGAGACDRAPQQCAAGGRLLLSRRRPVYAVREGVGGCPSAT